MAQEDAPAVYAACQDPELLHWIPVIPRPYTEEDALAFVRGELGLGTQYAVTEEGRVIGTIGMRVNEQNTGTSATGARARLAAEASRPARSGCSAATPSTN